MAEEQAEAPRFEIFRGADAPTLDECGCMTREGEAPNLLAVMPRIMKAGMERGEQVDVPYRRPGMSLSRLWLKSGFPLPLHSHDCDCLYYIVAGSIQLGSETLAAGDGFFVGSEVPYGYSAGPEGAEVIEFRATDSFNIRIRDKPVAAWEKDAEKVRAAQERWASEPFPGGRLPERA
ncbi:hypothetical protein GCM10011494_02390 [Novosphingobium endophyticum]|uniref:Cupin domain-containing protein n=1 Tax=Novosphingobium endophyticum TaxID=1955250 RepID=A0A916TQF1_9SPHN|nr:hypothetical protein [Novosphingobium endophyticum]GGB87556.1 hypothetical protein GCM10011494_02390 [Novosphingobium endophyticum]